MATAQQRYRLRRKLGGTVEAMPDEYLNDLWDEAAETHIVYGDDAVMLKARILGLDDLIMQASKDVDYQQNETSEKLSQRMKALQSEREKLEGDLAALVAENVGPGLGIGKMKPLPTRREDYPRA